MTLEKQCRDCGQAKPLEEFDRQRGRGPNKDYRRPECKKCKRDSHARWSATPEGRATIRRGIMARTFGLSPSAFAAMKEAQGGVCAICRLAETKRHRSGVTCE